MRAIAEFIMRGRMQATLVVAAAAALPLLFWLSAAASALVLLRRGMQDAVTIVVWAVLPALAWWYFAEPRTLLVLLGTLSLAQLLRRTQSWVAVLLASVPLGLLFALVLGEQFQESIARLAQELNTLMQQQMGEILQQWTEAERARMDSLVVPVLTGLMAALLQLLSLLSLMLARYWQAALYNPGGFAGEFHALRLSPLPAFGLLLALLLVPNVAPQLAMLVPLCTVPLALAGVALLHGLVAQKRLAGFWLVGLYVSLLLFLQLIYPLLMVLAIVDSLFDFRGRQRHKPDDAANGEG